MLKLVFGVATLLPGVRLGAKCARALAAGILVAQASAMADVIGLAYGQSESVVVRRYEDASGQFADLNTFSWPGLYGGIVLADPQLGEFYAKTGSADFYTFDLRTGAAKSVATLDTHPVQTFTLIGPRTLIGLNYDIGADRNEIRKIDILTGASTVLNQVAFESGFYFPHLSVNAARDTFYVISSNNRLYSIDANTGAVRTSAQLNRTLLSFEARADGSILGIEQRGPNGEYAVLSIDPATGIANGLSSIDVGQEFLFDTIAADMASNRLYFQDTAKNFYTADLTSGLVLGSVAMATSYQGFTAVSAVPELNSFRYFAVGSVLLILWSGVNRKPNSRR